MNHHRCFPVEEGELCDLPSVSPGWVETFRYETIINGRRLVLIETGTSFLNPEEAFERAVFLVNQRLIALGLPIANFSYALQDDMGYLLTDQNGIQLLSHVMNPVLVEQTLLLDQCHDILLDHNNHLLTTV